MLLPPITFVALTEKINTPKKPWPDFFAYKSIRSTQNSELYQPAIVNLQNKKGTTLKLQPTDSKTRQIDNKNAIYHIPHVETSQSKILGKPYPE